MAAKQVNTYEEALTAAERKAITKRVRSELIESVMSVLRDQIAEEAYKIVKREVKAANKDNDFMSRTRKIVRDEMEAEVKAFVESFEVTSGRW
jgi:hypothetical protein